MASLFLHFQPLTGCRHMVVTEHRTKPDSAGQMKERAEAPFPTATRIRVVLDNLNTPTKGALYEAFEPQEAKWIADRLGFHCTPKHGSWLNMAEIEFSVLTNQCLDRRIPDQATLVSEVGAWEAERNEHHDTVNGQFKMADVRMKLKRLYPWPHSS